MMLFSQYDESELGELLHKQAFFTEKRTKTGWLKVGQEKCRLTKGTVNRALSAVRAGCGTSSEVASFMGKTRETARKALVELEANGFIHGEEHQNGWQRERKWWPV